MKKTLTTLLGLISGFRGGFYLGFFIHLIFLATYFVSNTTDQNQELFNARMNLILKIVSTVLGIASATFSAVIASRDADEYLEKRDPVILIFTLLPIVFYYFYL